MQKVPVRILGEDFFGDMLRWKMNDDKGRLPDLQPYKAWRMAFADVKVQIDELKRQSKQIICT
jgi:hypothetical protein